MDYSIGDIIHYTTYGGGIRRVQVTEKDADIKNGRPGFVGRLVGAVDEDGMVWGYDYQIIRKAHPNGDRW